MKAFFKFIFIFPCIFLSIFCIFITYCLSVVWSVLGFTCFVVSKIYTFTVVTFYRIIHSKYLNTSIDSPNISKKLELNKLSVTNTWFLTYIMHTLQCHWDWVATTWLRNNKESHFSIFLLLLYLCSSPVLWYMFDYLVQQQQSSQYGWRTYKSERCCLSSTWILALNSHLCHTSKVTTW